MLIVAFCILSGLPPSEARRVALVIGNTDYSIGPLANPVRDAEAVAEAFGARLGFEKVILKTNLKADAFRAALLELSRESAGAEVAAVFFAGHGTEVNGKKPTDAESLRRLLRDALAIGDATVKLQRGEKTEVVKVSLPE